MLTCPLEAADARALLHERPPPSSFDVVRNNAAHPPADQLLFGSPQALAQLRMYAFRRYQDHRRFLALERPYVRRVLGRIAASAGLRNRIAHEYGEIDPQKLYQAVCQAVHDLPEYARRVDAWLEQQAPGC